MPVPKRQYSRSRRDRKAAGKHKVPLIPGACMNCAAAIPQHAVCQDCGFYKGVKVLRTKADRAQEREVIRKTKASTKSKKMSKQEVVHNNTIEASSNPSKLN